MATHQMASYEEHKARFYKNIDPIAVNKLIDLFGDEVDNGNLQTSCLKELAIKCIKALQSPPEHRTEA